MRMPVVVVNMYVLKSEGTHIKDAFELRNDRGKCFWLLYEDPYDNDTPSTFHEFVMNTLNPQPI